MCVLSNPFFRKSDKVRASEVLSFLAKTYQNTLKDYDAKVDHINTQYQIIIDLLEEIKAKNNVWIFRNKKLIIVRIKRSKKSSNIMRH